ncbi:MAG: glycosyltransferase family 39 protein [Acidocella sp.]|nr:glycosyltransferase family 39 protein [Acidocella sp.]
MELRCFSHVGMARQVRLAVRLAASPWLLALGVLTAVRLLMAALLPLSPDEAYYWIWSVHLQAGYFDHPPMVAYWIRAGTMLCGTSAFGVRLLGPLAAAAGSLLLWDAGERLFPNRHAGVTAAALFNATLITGVGSVLMTPDTPLIFFWTASIAATARWLGSRDDRWWLAIGVAAGAALLSKYTGLLLVAAIGLWLLTGRPRRLTLRSPWPWLGLVLAAAVFAPDVYWNAAHHWVSYFKQGGRVTMFDAAHAAQYFAELLIGQIGLATPLVFFLAALGLWRLRRVGGDAASLLLWLVLLPGGVFVEHVLSGRVEPNWPAIMFMPACLAAATLAQPVLQKWLRPALGLGFACTLAVYAQALAAPFPIPAARDPAALQLAGWPELLQPLGVLKPAFITSNDYTTLAELAWTGPPGVPIIAFGTRWHDLSLAVVNGGGSGLSVSRYPAADCALPLSTSTRMLARKRGADPALRYYVCDVNAPPDAVRLPHP